MYDSLLILLVAIDIAIHVAIDISLLWRQHRQITVHILLVSGKADMQVTFSDFPLKLIRNLKRASTSIKIVKQNKIKQNK